MSAARDSWVEAIAGLLGDGPLHPNELARRANRLRAFGQESPALIASLLGPDPRFRLDPEGRWQLTPGLAGVRSSLGFLDYAVVDVETTGGAYEEGHRIIELAIVELREGVVTREFQSLVNPERGIGASVTRLTGISATRVAAAPRFRDIAGEIRSRLEHRVFAAHNADHDWAFVGGQLREALGDAPRMQRLCTEQLSRRLLASQRRHHLDALCGRFGIEVHGRHRALGDARAAAGILKHLLQETERKGVRDLRALRELLVGPGGRDPVDGLI